VRRSLDARLGWYIGLGTVPIALAGFAFRDQIEHGARDLHLIAAALIVFGLVLAAADRLGTHRRGIDDLRARDGAVIGLAQALALVPGVSRSGATISAGLFLGLDRAAAARYSFLLSVPAVVLSGLFELRHIGGGGVDPVATAIATGLAFAAGYASIAFLLRFLVTHTTAVFVIYRIALGALVLALLSAGAIS
jgi:undecaprenyl-diphosphatase